jgi:hypothetical protein
MSNSLAIATVMGALGTRVQTLLNDSGLTGFDVSNGHPRGTPDSGVYLALYQMMPNTGLRNADLPTRGTLGSVRQRPVLPLTLRILISFVGDTEALEPERLAGLVLADLHARPVIGPDEIQAYLATLATTHPLRPSDLAQQPERVKLSPVSLDSEELSRIWGLFGQNIFALSMAWEATAVLLDGSTVPSPGLPVTDVGLAVVPAPVPRLAEVHAEATHQPVVEAADTLIVVGSGLMSENAELAIGAARRPLAPDDVDAGRLRIDLGTVPGLRAGVQPVTVIHSIVVAGAANGGIRPGPVSNALGLMVRPTLGAVTVAAVTGARTVRLATTPPIEPEQRAELILDAGPVRRSAREFVRDGNDIVFTFPDLPDGTYRVRLTVEGAANMPTRTGDVFDGPRVDVP